MGCYHHNQKVSELKQTLEKLEDEEKEYKNVLEEINSIVGTLDSYYSYFSNLFVQLNDIIVNGEAFDADLCLHHRLDIASARRQLNNISKDIQRVIDEEFPKEIKEINNNISLYESTSCQECLNKATESTNFNSTPRGGKSIGGGAQINLIK